MLCRESSWASGKRPTGGQRVSFVEPAKGQLVDERILLVEPQHHKQSLRRFSENDVSGKSYPPA